MQGGSAEPAPKILFLHLIHQPSCSAVQCSRYAYETTARGVRREETRAGNQSVADRACNLQATRPRRFLGFTDTATGLSLTSKVAPRSAAFRDASGEVVRACAWRYCEPQPAACVGYVRYDKIITAPNGWSMSVASSRNQLSEYAETIWWTRSTSLSPLTRRRKTGKGPRLFVQHFSSAFTLASLHMYSTDR